jgi:hypothetical protein
MPSPAARFRAEVVAFLLMPERFMMNCEQSVTTPLIQWEFERDNRHLMCGVHASQTESSYEVAMLPLWNGGPMAVESFDTAGEALRRHAAIAASLRDSGWTVSSYTE